ncbi:MAG TPA: hypothetical protein VJU77_02540 [Chthoniobacterales bacterium]|nr:hypothetical protein [Chthoniobacterales bacterium]
MSWSPIFYLLTALIFRDPMTRADGRTSAAQAFSFRELRTLAETCRVEEFRAREVCFCAPGDLVEPRGQA